MDKNYCNHLDDECYRLDLLDEEISDITKERDKLLNGIKKALNAYSDNERMEILLSAALNSVNSIISTLTIEQLSSKIYPDSRKSTSSNGI